MEEGFYWVKRLSKYGDEWDIGKYYGDDIGWSFLGILQGGEDGVEFEIGEKIERK